MVFIRISKPSGMTNIPHSHLSNSESDVDKSEGNYLSRSFFSAFVGNGKSFDASASGKENFQTKGSRQDATDVKTSNKAQESGKNVEEGRPVVVTMHAHVRRVSSMTTVCVFITSLLVLTTGVIGGVYLYRQFAHYKSSSVVRKNIVQVREGNQVMSSKPPHQLRHFKGWCSIPYPEEPDAPRHEAFKTAFQQPTKETETKEKPKNTFFEEEFDIDIKTEQYERIGVPGFAHSRRAQFIHDFIVNKTGIVDFENRRCFLMVLNRNFVLPPRLLYEQVSKMRAGYYDIDIHVVRHTMQVIIPPVNDMKNVGFIIARDCSSFPIYMLERAIIPVHKRSIEKTEATFVEFAGGDKINEITIVNLDQAVPGEHS